jgi:hypothetical protein
VWGFYRRAGVLGRVKSGSDGAGDARQQVRQGEGGPVAGDDGGGCAAKGGMGGGSALQRGRGAGGGGRAGGRGGHRWVVGSMTLMFVDFGSKNLCLSVW